LFAGWLAYLQSWSGCTPPARKGLRQTAPEPSKGA
jgi:hypothetical protein